MEKFFKDFATYCREASYDSLWFWGILLLTIAGIWIMTIIGLKIFRKREKLKTVFFVHKAWVISSLLASFVIISYSCYHWTQNTFATASKDYRLALLIALAITGLIPIIALTGLRAYYNMERIKEITDQPKTELQMREAAIPNLMRAFERIKWFFLIPLPGFLFLLFYVNKGTNLISIVYDNSESMIGINASDALFETFGSLAENNEIFLTTLNGVKGNKDNMSAIMSVRQSSELNTANVVSYINPIEASNNLSAQLSQKAGPSPIAESIWKMWLVVNESKVNQTYKKKLLLIITDGYDQICETMTSGRFFFDDTKFAEYFKHENVYVIDYSGEVGKEHRICEVNYFIQRFRNAGCDIYPAENSKIAYLNAFDNALQSFKNNWYFIIWTIVIFTFFTFFAIIKPSKIKPSKKNH